MLDKISIVLITTKFVYLRIYAGCPVLIHTSLLVNISLIIAKLAKR